MASNEKNVDETKEDTGNKLLENNISKENSDIMTSQIQNMSINGFEFDKNVQ